MNKKKYIEVDNADIHTIVDLPLEAVLEHLKELDPETYETKIENLDAETSTFSIKTKRLSDIVVVEAKGSVRRWKGTFTRLDADIRFPDVSTEQFIRVFAIPLIILSIIPILALLLINLPPYTPFYPLICGALPIVMLFLSVVALIIYATQKKALDDKKARHLKVHRALIYNLANELEKGLKEKAAVMKFDGTEDNLLELLQEEKYRHFRLGADGEIQERHS